MPSANSSISPARCRSAVRAVFGFQSSRDYWFPDVRSLGGAVLVLGSVLYPYIYLACRSMFLMQGRAAADVARTLGAGPLKVFFKVQIPMARPAIMVGLTLVMMETLNDIGAVEYLGVQTADLLDLRYLAQPRQSCGRGADRLRHAGLRGAS